MNLITATDARVISGGRIFRIHGGQNLYDILRLAEKVFGSIVIFDPGSFEMPDLFEYENISAIVGAPKCQSCLVRYGNGIFKSVQKYAHTDIRREVGDFSILDKAETSLGALEFGGSQGGHVHDIFTAGAAADLLQLTNAEPVENPPLGHAFGTWTENWTVERIMISSCNQGAIRTKVLDGQRRFQSFCNLNLLNIQMGLIIPGCIGVDFGDHSNAYCGHFGFKFNIEQSAIDPSGIITPATCINVQNNCTIHGAWDSYVEGNPIRNEEGNVITPAGRRIAVHPTARVTGHGKFYRQDPEAITDLLTPGVTWDGKAGGLVEDGILADQ